MSQRDIDALSSIRATLVGERRSAADAGDSETVIRVQRDIGLIDAALLDEQALGQHEKDEIAHTRAMRRVPDASKIPEISLVADPIRVSD
jgi:hypothetical protein